MLSLYFSNATSKNLLSVYPNFKVTMKLLAIVITYFPNEQELVQNIKSYIDEVDKIIIWENTPEDQISYNKVALKDISYNKIFFIGKGYNVGIGEALNFGAKIVLEDSFSHLLTLDQDSYFEKGMLCRYKESVRKFLTSNIGLYGTNLLYSNGIKEYREKESIINVKYCITSGSIIPGQTFEKGCFFDEHLFIDGVDLDYCFRLNKLFGLRVIVFPSVHMMHSIGYPIKTFLGFSASAYSAFRTYYVVKNQILILRRYPEFFSFKEKLVIINDYIFKRLFTILFYENNKLAKIVALAKGLREGLLN